MTALTVLDKLHRLRLAAGDRRLSRADLAAFIVLVDRMDGAGEAWPGFGSLAKDTGADRSTVIRAIERLEQLGYITRTAGHKGTSNRYRLGPLTSGGHATSGAAATSGADATTGSGVDATGVVAPTPPPVVAPTPPESIQLNQSNEPTQLNLSTGDGFAEFWSAYPRKEAKPAAEKAWRKHRLDGQLGAILADLQRRAADPTQWTDRKYIPHPATYLNQRRWEDAWQPSTGVRPTVLPAGRLSHDPRSDDELAAENQARLAGILDETPEAA